jgi:hypothetical protein
MKVTIATKVFIGIKRIIRYGLNVKEKFMDIASITREPGIAHYVEKRKRHSEQTVLMTLCGRKVRHELATMTVVTCTKCLEIEARSHIIPHEKSPEFLALKEEALADIRSI